MKEDVLLSEALSNIREDRKKVKNLLKELQGEISSADTTHARSGVVAAKYVETLQRSNEQLVKIIAMIDKNKKEEEDTTLSSEEKDSIFELIKEVS
mgnify:FL=1|tara:strand:- start:59 stop:346 length:288 start_codon:yes stop_codon:yes gene_type:complete